MFIGKHVHDGKKSSFSSKKQVKILYFPCGRVYESVSSVSCKTKIRAKGKEKKRMDG